MKRFLFSIIAWLAAIAATQAGDFTSPGSRLQTGDNCLLIGGELKCWVPGFSAADPNLRLSFQSGLGETNLKGDVRIISAEPNTILDDPDLILQRLNPAPANGDVLASIQFQGYDSALNSTTYGKFSFDSPTITDGAESGRLFLDIRTGGTSLPEYIWTGTEFRPFSNDGNSLGIAGNAFSDLFLAEGGVINWDSSDVTITQTGNVLAFAGAITGYTFDAPVSVGDPLTITSTDAGAGTLPSVVIDRDSATPAAGDNLGVVVFQANDSILANTTFAQIRGELDDPTDTSEDGALYFTVMTAGTLLAEMELRGADLRTSVNDGLALGVGGFAFSDLFLAEGGTVSWDTADVILTQTSNAITFTGNNSFSPFDATGGTFSLTDNAIISWVSGDATLSYDATANTFVWANVGSQTFRGTAAAGADSPDINIDNDATAAAGLNLGHLQFTGNDSGAGTPIYAAVRGEVLDHTDASEDGELRIMVMTAGAALADEVKINGTETAPSSSGGNALGSTTNQWNGLYLVEGSAINWDNGDVTITQVNNIVTAAGLSEFGFSSVDGGSAIDPELVIDRDSATPGTNDTGGQLTFRGNDSTLADQEYASINTQFLDVNDTTEDAEIRFYPVSAGAEVEEYKMAVDAFSPVTSDGAALGTTTAMWSDAFFAEGAVLNWDNGDFTFTQSGNTGIWGNNTDATITFTYDTSSTGDVTYDAVNNQITYDNADNTGISFNLDNSSTLTFFEDDGNGANFKAFVAPAAFTGSNTCTFEDDANFIPDSCVGDGTDDDVPESGDFGALTGGTGIDNNSGTLDFDASELANVTFGSSNFGNLAFSTDGVDLAFDVTTVDGAVQLSGGGTSPIFALDDNGSLRFLEEDAGGNNFIAFVAPAAITSDVTCTFENDANPIPDSCVGDGTDGGGGLTDPATLESTDAGAAAGPTFNYYRNSASPAADDLIGITNYQGEDSAGNTQTYAAIGAKIQSTTDTSEDGLLLFYTANNATVTEAMRIDDFGALIVGASQINSTGAFSGSTIRPLFQGLGTSTGPKGAFASYAASDTEFAGLFLAKSANETDGSHTALASGEDIGRISLQGSDGTDFEEAASIRAFADAATGSGDMPGRLVLYTTPDASATPSERFRINSSGALGIAGANFGTSNQAMLSGGSAAAPSWGSITGKKARWIGAGSLVPNFTNGCAPVDIETATNDIMARTCLYDPGTQEAAQYQIKMPDTWDEGTVTVRFVWSHPATATNFGVVWDVACLATSNDDALDTAMGTAQTTTDTGGTTDDVYISDETSAVTCAGTPAAGDYVTFRVRRVAADGSDNLAVDARLHGFNLYMTENAFVEP